MDPAGNVDGFDFRFHHLLKTCPHRLLDRCLRHLRLLFRSRLQRSLSGKLFLLPLQHPRHGGEQHLLGRSGLHGRSLNQLIHQAIEQSQGGIARLVAILVDMPGHRGDQLQEALLQRFVGKLFLQRPDLSEKPLEDIVVQLHGDGLYAAAQLAESVVCRQGKHDLRLRLLSISTCQRLSGQGSSLFFTDLKINRFLFTDPENFLIEEIFLLGRYRFCTWQFFRILIEVEEGGHLFLDHGIVGQIGGGFLLFIRQGGEELVEATLDLFLIHRLFGNRFLDLFQIDVGKGGGQGWNRLLRLFYLTESGNLFGLFFRCGSGLNILFLTEIRASDNFRKGSAFLIFNDIVRMFDIDTLQGHFCRDIKSGLLCFTLFRTGISRIETKERVELVDDLFGEFLDNLFRLLCCRSGKFSGFAHALLNQGGGNLATQYRQGLLIGVVIGFGFHIHALQGDFPIH